jgi:hypothetical protein
MNYESFEKFLEDKCDCHTNNSPEGFERWLEDLDGETLIAYADRYAQLKYVQGRLDFADELLPQWNELKANFEKLQAYAKNL